MKKQKKLMYVQSLFFLLVFVLLALIVINEKKETILTPKATKKIEEYLETNYTSLKETVETSTPNYQNKSFKMKITNKKNKHHYFYVTYSKRKISDTYQEDYVEGKSLITYLEKEITNEIKEKEKKSIRVTIQNTLNNFTQSVQEKLISEKELLNLKIYTIEEELPIKEWNSKEILKEIETTITKYNKDNITPKNYTFTITDTKEITKSIKIENITEDFIKKEDRLERINDIINNNNSKQLIDSKITYQYLN